MELGEIVTVGKSTQLRYQAPPFVASVPLTSSPDLGAQVPLLQSAAALLLSPEAEAVQKSVQRPSFERLPVGYQHGFLASYTPNASAYVDDKLRQHLVTQGEVHRDSYPAGTYAREIFQRFLIDLSWSSSALEGNTYSRLDTERLLVLGESADGKDETEARMILNHKEAISFLVDEAESIDIDRRSVFTVHALLGHELLHNRAGLGALRQHPVGITKSVYHPLGVPQLLQERFDEILRKGSAIRDPFEQAFFLLVHIPYLQPFEDINKRTARVMANVPFIRRNLVPLSFIDVPRDPFLQGILGVYEENRVELLRDVFVWAYERSCQRYNAVAQSVATPDRFRFKHQLLLRDVISAIIREPYDRAATRAYVRTRAEDLAPDERAQFVDCVDADLLSLHEYNAARFRVRPSEFAAWAALNRAPAQNAVRPEPAHVTTATKKAATKKAATKKAATKKAATKKAATKKAR